MKKRVLSAILTLALMLAFVPTAFIASADETVVYSFDFESDPFENGWQSADADGDHNVWTYMPYAAPMDNGNIVCYHSATGAVYSESFRAGNLTPDNLLISPWIDIPADGETAVSIWARGTDANDYAENFRFCYAVEGGTGREFTPFTDKMTTVNDWQEFSAKVPDEIKGKTVRFCIEHYATTGMYRIYADDFSVINKNDAANYDLRIRGEIIGDDNLTGDGFVFYPETNTLQIFDSIYYEFGSAIDSGIDGLTIVVGGDCTVSSDSHYGAISLGGYTDITGVGKLNVLNTSDGPAIEVNNGADLVIDGACVTATSADGQFAIMANVTSSTLSIAISDVVADACESAVYGFFDRVLLAGECISEPEGGYASGFQIYDSLGEPARRVHFSRAYTNIGAYGFYDYGENGFQDYIFSANAGDTSLYGYGAAGPEDNRIFSAAYAEGYYYGYGFDGDETTYYTIPLLGNGGDWVASPDATPDVPISISYDYRRGSLYGIATYIEMAGDRGLVQIDRATGATTVIGTLDHMYVGMACTDIGGGACYAVDFDGDVYLIDLDTADETYLFSTGVLCCGQQDLAYDYDTHTLYWLQYNENYDNDWGMYFPEGGLYIIDVVMQKCYYLGTIADGVEATGAVVTPEFDLTTNYAIRFDANGGKADKAMIFNDDIDRTFPTATGNGAFLGWFTERAGGEKVEDCGVVTEDLVLYAHYEGGAFMKGDMDKDGEITVADALKALRIAAQLVRPTEEDFLIGDVDNDGEITVADALKILRVAAKLIDQSEL